MLGLFEKIFGKLEYRGYLSIFVIYPEDHAFNFYQLFGIETKKIVESRYVRWLETFFNKLNNKDYLKM
jgi:hypothetical protein